MKPLKQITVLDMTVNTPGPFCSTILSSMGARVIKVEPPSGDPLRHNMSMFSSLNRGKESITLDLKTILGQEVLGKLASNADIILEGMRPGVAQRLGADYSTLSSKNQRLVYCSISGFGQEGPMRDHPGHDINYLSMGGYLGLQDKVEGRPWPPPILIADLSAGLYASIAVLGATLGCQYSGKGSYIDLSMTESVISLLDLELTDVSDMKTPNVTYIPHYGVFPCADGKWISLGIVDEDIFWKRLCDLIDLPSLSNLSFNERLDRASEIENVLHKTFLCKSSDSWQQYLGKEDLPISMILSLDELFEVTQFKQRGIFLERGNLPLPFQINTKSLRPGKDVPDRGSDSISLLGELGYGANSIKEIIDTGVLGKQFEVLN